VDNNNTEQLISKMQTAINMWEGGLSAIGGQLEPMKTYWYLIDFKWKNGVWKYATKEDVGATLTMSNESREKVDIERVEPKEARRTLGVRLAPDGNNQAEFLHLQTTCDLWADRIRCGMIPQKYARQAFMSTIWSKLTYSLPATTFTRQACNAIMKKMINATLSASGVNKNIPRDLVFGHQSRQGLGYPDMYVWQGAEAITRFTYYMN
jgi:hypothetical protein